MGHLQLEIGEELPVFVGCPVDERIGHLDGSWLNTVNIFGVIHTPISRPTAECNVLAHHEDLVRSKKNSHHFINRSMLPRCRSRNGCVVNRNYRGLSDGKSNYYRRSLGWFGSLCG